MEEIIEKRCISCDLDEGEILDEATGNVDSLTEQQI